MGYNHEIVDPNRAARCSVVDVEAEKPLLSLDQRAFQIPHKFDRPTDRVSGVSSRLALLLLGSKSGNFLILNSEVPRFVFS